MEFARIVFLGSTLLGCMSGGASAASIRQYPYRCEGLLGSFIEPGRVCYYFAMREAYGEHSLVSPFSGYGAEGYADPRWIRVSRPWHGPARIETRAAPDKVTRPVRHKQQGAHAPVHLRAQALAGPADAHPSKSTRPATAAAKGAASPAVSAPPPSAAPPLSSTLATPATPPAPEPPKAPPGTAIAAPAPAPTPAPPLTPELRGQGRADPYRATKETTASGEPWNPEFFTAAHATAPFGSRLRITRNGKSVEIRVNDRLSPEAQKRGVVLELTPRAAREIGIFPVGGNIRFESSE
jgi:hypothetical protein